MHFFTSLVLILDIVTRHPCRAMSHSDVQRRHPFPSRSNDMYRQNDQISYADEEYVPPLRMRRADFSTGPRHRHMKAFEEALMADDRSIVDYAASSPSMPGSPIVSQPAGTARIRKVSAMSDFAPVNIKVKRYVSRIQEPLCGPDTTTQTKKRDRFT